ncbi:M15 family metallopeptidase [Seonamhaeicola sp. MEBiC1930]|uniref:M15 family metallopeptidase n=1 Tax=Seonamhaeicola sp. MEBiC01930 TaxID=2976768 RepID=UPI0032469B80
MIKLILKFVFGLYSVLSFAQLPDGFVYVSNVIPDLDIELRYLTDNNFVGSPIDGYLENKLILTKETAEALKLVNEDLKSHDLCLKVYDGYRPQRAVNHFIQWAKKLNDTVTKSIFYPNVKKIDLFKEDYIASRSGHSRGSTVDITIVDVNTGNPIDMGSSYDFFGKESWVNYNEITKEQKANRIFLQELMKKYGFTGYPKEWWHFTLINEPFPNTYYDFLIQ